ncbi:epididymal-specific lipocalin-12 isoform X2 [Cervus canadensis]|uniref:epididymal-specific lipocalin-12 isoform X2 n=1 Tax=Cervus canadensis TaxID=1574408 RepID=UPI001C9E43BD|nr:epididymal-specific lipocalin-12 isoform X2 [Cervus canadensis]
MLSHARPAPDPSGGWLTGGRDPVHTPPRKLPLFCFGCARLAGSGHQVASQLKPGAHPELSQARNGPAAPSLKHVPQGHFRGQRCVTWSYKLISKSQPGMFSVDHSGEPGADPEEIQVTDTDYASFALLLSRRQSDLQSILRVSLLCRIWAIQTQLLDKFICLVRAQGLSDDNIVFPDLTDWSVLPEKC